MSEFLLSSRMLIRMERARSSQALRDTSPMDRCAHYTKEPFNHWLVQFIQAPMPQQVVDLGVGGGSLLSAAAERWRHADLIGIDVCATALARLQARLPLAAVRRADLMRGRVLKVLDEWSGSADVVLCNPPFTQTPPEHVQSAELQALLPDGLPASYLKRAEVVFLLHTLRLLRPGGEMGLVLPASFASGNQYLAFRQWLFTRCTVSRVVQLPAGAFAGADVHAFLWIAKNCKPSSHAQVELAFAERDRLMWTRKVHRAHAILRCDASFHGQSPRKVAHVTLAETGARVSRGRSVQELRGKALHYFHTTSFAQLPPNRQLVAGEPEHLGALDLAKTGDFLLGRVGRSCHAQIAEVRSGFTAYSDCVYRIQVPKRWRAAVRASLLSEEGTAWRASRLRGSAARLLALADLLQHPIAIQGKDNDERRSRLVE
ncbi:MAG: N-6 DNA methylase [Burkholderiales bacterium]|nr:N-6 DNA methylase [Burkholderiales bacterium]